MRRALSIVTVRVCFCFLVFFFALALGAPPAAAQVYGVVSPSSRTAALSGSPVTLSGWVLESGQAVSIEAVNQNTGELTPLATVNAATSGATYHVIRCHLGSHPPCTTVAYTLYPWSKRYGRADAWT